MARVERNRSRGTTIYRGRYRDPLGRAKTAGKSASRAELATGNEADNGLPSSGTETEHK